MKVERLIEQLGGLKRGQRQAAREALINMGPAAVGPLIARLGDEDGLVRAGACRVLGQLADPRAVGPLTSLLRDEKAYVQEAACEALGLLGQGPLAREALEQLRGARAVELLIARLSDVYSDMRQAACEALGRLGDARAVEPLIGRLGDIDRDVRQAAARALEGFGQGRLARATLGALEGSKKPSAVRELLALYAEGDTRWLAPVIGRLADTDRDVRRQAYEVLERAGEVRVAKAVRDLLRQVPQAVAELTALAAEGDLRATEPLVTLLDEVPAVRDAASRALESIAGIWEGRAAELLCCSCLVRLECRRAAKPRENTRWLVCRSCRRAGKVLKGIRQVVAVLDDRRTQEQPRHDGLLRVNWLKRRTLFDFDRVEIVAAPDEEVERFLIHVGNDTDAWRQKRYKRMPCRVAVDCSLSEHTLRILRRTFGEVVRV